jgi:hypothetical protein
MQQARWPEPPQGVTDRQWALDLASMKPLLQ